MTDPSWDRTKELFLAALDLPENDRRPFLDRECEGHEAMRDQVLRLLAASARSTSPLDVSVGEVAHHVLDGSVPMIERVGRYRIVQVLGKGGMGVVYLGVRDDLQSRVAIKVLRDASLSPLRREWFQREERLLAQLNHPSIARLFDADVLPDGTPYFVMEYVEGEPLTTYCQRNTASLRQRLQLLRAVGEAVQHAHGQAMIHRDLKPSNILVAPGATTDGPAIKLLDFGIARELDDLAPSSRLVTVSRLMTPAYAAPEQLRGGQIGVYTDVYALGVIAYELLTGVLPFDADTRSAPDAPEGAREAAPEPPSSRARSSAPQFPDPGKAAWADLDVLCLTAMHADPRRRYPTVEALIRDLDHWLGAQPLEARPDSLSYRLGKFVRRNRGAVLAASAALVAAIGLTTFYTIRLAAARDAAMAQTARTARLQRFMTGLFVGDDDVTLPDTLRVRQLIALGVERTLQFKSDPAFQAQLLETLGSIYRQLGAFSEADSVLQTSLQMRRAAPGTDSLDVAGNLISLAALRTDESKYDDAVSLGTEALAIARRSASPNVETIAKATNTLGMARVQQGKYLEAIGLLTEGLRLQQAHGADSAAISETTNILANAEYFAGRYDDAERHNRQVLAIDRARLGDRHPSIAHSLVNLGNLLYERERYEEAERRYREALSIDEGYNGKEHSSTARDLLLVGRTLSRRGRITEARPFIDRAYALYLKDYGPAHPRTAIAVSELAYLANATHDYATAGALYEKALGIVRAALGNGHSFVGTLQSLIAGVYLNEGALDRADTMSDAAIAGLTASLGVDHPVTLGARAQRGRILLRLGRQADAATILEATVAALDQHPQTAAPSVLRNARTDLVAAYEALGRRTDADRVRKAMTASPTVTR